MGSVELDDEIYKYLDRFGLRADEIKHLIGICRHEEGREFLFGKIKDALYSLDYLRFLIRKQFGCELCHQKPDKYKSEYKKVKNHVRKKNVSYVWGEGKGSKRRGRQKQNPL